MKPWIIFSVFFVITVVDINNAANIPEHIKKQAKKLHKLCQSQTSASDDIIKSALSGVLPKDKNFECYVHCLLDKSGIMDETDVIHLDYLLQVLPDEMHANVQMLSDTCGTKAGSDKCNIAYNTLQCYVENNPFAIKDTFEGFFD